MIVSDGADYGKYYRAVIERWSGGEVLLLLSARRSVHKDPCGVEAADLRGRPHQLPPAVGSRPTEIQSAARKETSR